ncbi:DMT family transporter [Nocardioides speluncae]|uniref:DMT family transporter n=1 Tax=Nocardioides speluncae TaxID=2670337 RepID=UPI000D691AE3|nr:DMT family transporter [Nocardioides speluncae]
MAILLALVAAVAYGLSDFIGGLVSRRASPWSVATVGMCASTVCTALLAAFVTGEPTRADFAWAAFAGVGSGMGAGFLYRGLSQGRMGVVAPLSAVGAAVVPVMVGVVTGERPGAFVWVGIVLAFPAIWLVASTPADEDPLHCDEPRESTTAAVIDGLLAGAGFGVLFAALGQVPDEAGLWPLTLTQAVSVPAVVVLALALRAPWVPRGRYVWWSLGTGPLGTAATLFFLLASQRGYLTIAGVLTSLYPAATVLLAWLVLKERIHRAQALGLALCAFAVAMVAAG